MTEEQPQKKSAKVVSDPLRPANQVRNLLEQVKRHLSVLSKAVDDSDPDLVYSLDNLKDANSSALNSIREIVTSLDGKA